MKILLVGASGQLGREICRSALPSGTTLIAAAREKLNLDRPSEIYGFVSKAQPDLVINAAGYTAIEQAEHEYRAAFRINRDGAAKLAEAAGKSAMPIIHISCHHIFDGAKQGEYQEDDAPNPQNIYGASKLAGEKAVAQANPRHLIIRTSRLYTAQGQGLLRRMICEGKRSSHLAVDHDRYARPTSAADLAHALLEMAMQAMERNGLWGIYNFTNSGEPANCLTFAREMFSGAASWFKTPPPLLLAKSSDTSSNRCVKDPPNGALDLGKIRQVFGLQPRSWQEALHSAMEELRLEDRQMRA